MLTRANKVVETRDGTWEATLDVEASPPRLLELPEQGGAEELEDVPEPGGADDFDSAPTTPPPVLGRGIPHQLRAVSPKAPADDDFQAEMRSRTMHQRSAANRPTATLHLGMGAMRHPLTMEPRP